MTMVRTSRAARLGRAVLAPAIWLERARGRRRLALAALYVLAFAICGLLIWRATSLNGLPDVGEPFDVAAVARVDLADDRNAFVLYRQAVAKLREMTPEEISVMRGFDWGLNPPEIHRWAEQNREALDLWRLGTERPDALAVRPADLTIEVELGVVQKIRNFARLALLEASRLEGQGDMAGAWGWYRAVLRCSRHNCRYACYIERLIAVAMHAITCSRLPIWADDPRTEAPLLRRALADLKAIDALTPPPSESLKVEYLSSLEYLADPLRPKRREWMDQNDDKEVRYAWYHFLPGFREAQFWLMREPERARRLFRIMVANWLAFGDLPPSRRPPIPPGTFLFAAGPDAPPSARALSPEAFMSWVHSSPLADYLMPSMDNLQKALDRERATQAATLVRIAEEVYEREHGAPPRTLGELVGPLLESLPDGYDADEPVEIPAPAGVPGKRP